MPLGRVYVPPPTRSFSTAPLTSPDDLQGFRKIEIKIEKREPSPRPVAIQPPTPPPPPPPAKPPVPITFKKKVPIEIEVASVVTNGHHQEDVDDNNNPQSEVQNVPIIIKNEDDIIEDEIIAPPPVTEKVKTYQQPLISGSAKGLKNLGNTCYMNSIIQCLIHTQKLLEFAQDLVKDTPTTHHNGSKMKITKAFARLTTEMWKSSSSSGINNGIHDPSSFRREIGTFAPKFMGFDQHDSQEFLLYALDGIHTELNQKDPNPQITYKDIEEENISAKERSERCWRFYLSKDNSLITDLFLGQFRSTLKCTQCEHESVIFEPFWVVSVPLAKDTVDLQECLELFVRAETLDGEEMPKCEACKERRRCIKWYSFERWPPVLVIHLKRFSGSYRTKLSNMIQTPLKALDLSSFSSCDAADAVPAIYECYGVSNHSGTLSGGHYTAACRHPHGTDWHFYNDRCVSGITSDRVISAEAYLLFFKRKSD